MSESVKHGGVLIHNHDVVLIHNDNVVESFSKAVLIQGSIII